MIKYIIVKYTSDGFGGNLAETRTIKKSELNKYIANGWEIVEKINPIITPTTQWWNKFTIDNKLVILSFVVPSFIAIFLGVLAHQTNKENDTLRNENKTLNHNNNQLKQILILTSDSLNIEREKSKAILQELQAKTSFGKKN